VQGYTSAVRWFAADYLLGPAGKTSWDQVDARDIQQWTAQLDRYSSAYASIQFRALRQFFKWRAAEEQCPDPMTRLRAPKVAVTAVPVFTSAELSELAKACQGRSFAARRDAAIIAVLTATGIRLSELAGICCHPGDPARSDLDLHGCQIRIRGKGGTARTVKISHQAARSLDRYLRARARHPQAWRPQLWLGVNGRGPLTATGIYQIVARRGRQAGVTVYPHRFRHHFSHTWLDRGGAERDLMELNGWTSPQMLTRYGASARSARARRSYDRIMNDTTQPRQEAAPHLPRAQRSAGPQEAAWATQGRHIRHEHERPATQDTRRQPQSDTMAITQGQLLHSAGSPPVAPNA
jgi:site-specific recombinase XerD